MGMVSDEIEVLRGQGKTDEDIAALIRTHSGIELSASDITENYATPDQRHAPPGE